jgi:hypothetical protein
MRRGPKNAYLDSLNEIERCAYWRGYDRGYKNGSECEKLTRMESKVIKLRMQLNKLGHKPCA